MNIRITGLFLVALIAAFASCKKSGDVPVAVTLADSLNIVNASTNTINYYLNGTRLNNNSNLYPGGSSGYYYVPTGTQTYQVKKAFDPATSVVQQLFSIPLDLEAHHYYSLFITDDTAAHAFYIKDALRPENRTDTCLVRFVNASPNSGSLDFAVGDTLKFSNKAFTDTSDFRPVGVSGLKAIALYQSGSAEPLVSGHYPLVAGRSYTFYAKGKKGGSGNTALNLGVTLNYN
ncbi:DUF4397 domain-containing protein [Mucilaginibacter ginsenosidivorans]|uniref:DUF4397 domain-containing protein n=1 Tax=Mucilaginibacter ginsenosidivorans TaxID=398053 RepID=A0A5B8V0W3_9SPHI|nr:DUF4397 domain-containing protein [Mucilaginibacter ginsenosidivorans]QEC65147.1 DUF4397 domain-containing protein [Mucilaginibacter ginsenosidivorans]